MTITATVSAVCCGRQRDGQPIARRQTFDLVRDPEPFGDHNGRARSRLWGHPWVNALRGTDTAATAPLAVVWTDTIEVLA